ncbi:MAG: cupin domain-containing protein [Ruminococcaceae bacterium]|nr:cupin domain-containing protein [Oscillospiraceae bacterium]
MIIKFENIEKTVMPNFYGGEKELSAAMFLDEMNRIMKATLIPGASIGFHKHETSSEILYILSGSGKVVYEDGETLIKEGECHYCKKGTSHSLVNTGNKDLVFFAVVPQQ